MAVDIAALVAKAFRVRGPRARQLYVRARQAGRVFRDARRRSVLASLPQGPFRIPDDRGFVTLPPRTLGEADELAQQAMARIAVLRSRQKAAEVEGKRFLQNVLDQSSLALDSPALRLALRADVLAAVSHYLGTVPLLTAVSLFVSEPQNRAPRSSQLYHCDGDDVRQVKVFVYCTDVGPESGPLTVLDAEASARVMAATRYRFRQRLADADVEGIVGRGSESVMLGPAGSVAIVDTSRCFHFGSRVAAGATLRVAAMIQFQTPWSFMLPERNPPFRHLVHPRLPELHRLVLGA